LLKDFDDHVHNVVGRNMAKGGEGITFGNEDFNAAL